MNKNEEKYNEEILKILEMMKPKIKKVLLQTSLQNREDLEQELIELIIKKIKDNSFDDAPGFFEFINKQKML